MSIIKIFEDIKFFKKNTMSDVPTIVIGNNNGTINIPSQNIEKGGKIHASVNGQATTIQEGKEFNNSKNENERIITTSNGDPVHDNQHSMTAGARGPVLLQDFHLIDKLASFDAERIPERVVHAVGSGAHGVFEV